MAFLLQPSTACHLRLPATVFSKNANIQLAFLPYALAQAEVSSPPRELLSAAHPMQTRMQSWRVSHLHILSNKAAYGFVCIALAHVTSSPLPARARSKLPTSPCFSGPKPRPHVTPAGHFSSSRLQQGHAAPTAPMWPFMRVTNSPWLVPVYPGCAQRFMAKHQLLQHVSISIEPIIYLPRS